MGHGSPASRHPGWIGCLNLVRFDATRKPSSATSPWAMRSGWMFFGHLPSPLGEVLVQVDVAKPMWLVFSSSGIFAQRSTSTFKGSD